MPILFIHGVAIREGDEPQWATLHRLTRGVNWSQIQESLRAHVAPALNPAHPEEVALSFLYWGDLGARYALGGRFQGSRLPDRPWPERLDALDEEVLGELLERRLRQAAPPGDWPALVEAGWAVARDTSFRDVLRLTPPPDQWSLAEAAVRARLHPAAGPALLWPPLSEEWRLQRQRDMQRVMLSVRRPLEAFMPLFLGDVLCYLNGRGTAGSPGRIAQRVLDGLHAADKARQGTGEPLIVLTHSMGGQLLYDALTALVPADPALARLRVDFWCAAGSQVGLFKELGLFLEEESPHAVPLSHSPHLGYFWNVWSLEDLLSFRAEGVVEGAHDMEFPMDDPLQSGHVAYLHHPEFYLTLAAKLRVHLQR
ncbi:hypothetical protein [Deinococcus apachensis]|uniref:hypothetical protein n=1 Tax=Deinococcus apachensis TaxID=309886 RepID=UPI0003649C82|nr:hypothetical protein [Deinococcus apachensis]